MTHRPTLDASTTVDRLRAWASGSSPLTAAVELLTRAFEGRFADPAQPWIIVESSGYVWLDEQILHASLSRLSRGEYRVLEVVCALADPASIRRIDLLNIITGVDQPHLDLILAALNCAADSPEHIELDVTPADGQTAFVRPGPRILGGELGHLSQATPCGLRPR